MSRRKGGKVYAVHDEPRDAIPRDSVRFRRNAIVNEQWTIIIYGQQVVFESFQRKMVSPDVYEN